MKTVTVGEFMNVENSGHRRLMAAFATLILVGIAIYTNRDEDLDGDGMPDARIAEVTAN